MTHNKRSKNSRQRGTHTHGWGAMKKHRGAGHRGGRGNAGSGKKGDAKKTKYWKDTNYFGSKGFHSLIRTTDITLNIGELDSRMDKLVEQNIAEKKGDIYTIDLGILKVTKLLGNGKATRKINITVEKATEKATQKIQEAGGKVTILNVEETETESEEDSE